MKKTLLALAVAGVVAAPAAMAEVTVYGLAHVSVDNIGGDTTGPLGEQDLAVNNRFSRVGVKAAEDLGGGLKAIAQMEWGVDMTGDNASTQVAGDNNISARNQVVGLAGGFGTVVAGRHDTPYKMATGKLDVFADTAADYNFVIGQNSLDNRANEAIAYLSPDFNGLSVQVAVVAAENNQDTTNATSIAVQYNAGPLFVSVANEDFTNGHSGTKVGVGYDAGVAKVGVIYEMQSDVSGGADDYDAWLVNAAIPVGGNNTIIAEYGVGEFDKVKNERSIMAVGVAHNFSKSSSAYVAYGNVEIDAGTANSSDVLTAGLVVKF